jgi:hypothetical protein
LPPLRAIARAVERAGRDHHADSPTILYVTILVEGFRWVF